MEKNTKISKLNIFSKPDDTERYLSFLGQLEEMTELEIKIEKKSKDLDEILDIFLNKIPPMRKEIEELSYNFLFLVLEKLKSIELKDEEYNILQDFACLCTQYCFRFNKPTKEENELIKILTSYDLMHDLDIDAMEIRNMIKMLSDETGIKIDPDSIDAALLKSGNYEQILNSVQQYIKEDFNPVKEPYKLAKIVHIQDKAITKKEKKGLKFVSEKILEYIIDILKSDLFKTTKSEINIKQTRIELENEIKKENYFAVFFVFNNLLRDYPELIRKIPEEMMGFLGSIQYFRNLALKDYYKSLRFQRKYFIILNILGKNRTKSMKNLEEQIQIFKNLIYNFRKDNSDYVYMNTKFDIINYL